MLFDPSSKRTPGVKRAISVNDLIPLLSSVSCENALMLIGTFEMTSDWRVAVTTISLGSTSTVFFFLSGAAVCAFAAVARKIVIAKGAARIIPRVSTVRKAFIARPPIRCSMIVITVADLGQGVAASPASLRRYQAARLGHNSTKSGDALDVVSKHWMIWHHRGENSMPKIEPMMLKSTSVAPPGSSRRGFLAGLGGAAVGISLTGLAGCGPRGKSINFYNWDTYIGKTTLADFQKASGIKVKMSLFANNDELFAKLRGGNQGYDVIVPTNDFVERMVDANMLLPLNHAGIPNFKNIAPNFQDADFDHGRRFSMPYTWLVLGIGYRKSKSRWRSGQLEMGVQFGSLQGPHRIARRSRRPVPPCPQISGQ